MDKPVCKLWNNLCFKIQSWGQCIKFDLDAMKYTSNWNSNWGSSMLRRVK